MSDIERIKENVRAMLNLARNNAAADGEIRNALAFAQRLMDEHNLSEADLTASEHVAIDLERAEFARQSAAVGKLAVANWEALLGIFVADFIGGVKFYQHTAEVMRGPAGGVIFDERGQPKRSGGLTFYGLAEEVALAVDLYQEIRTTIAAMARVRCGQVYRGDGRNYCEGFVDGLRSKLQHEQQRIAQQATASGSTALVVKRNELATAKRTAAAKWLAKSEGIRLGSSGISGSGNYSPTAYGQGLADGRQHNTTASRRPKLGYNG